MRILSLCLLAALAGCGTIQTAFVDADGRHGAGSIKGGVVNMTDGKFEITDAGVSCTGDFESWSSPTVVFPVKCSDGRSGHASMTRPTTTGAIAGEGTMRFTDGTQKAFVFGPG